MGFKDNWTSKDPIAKKGMRIRMISMEDERPIDEGLEGTIEQIDDLGTLHVRWDDGRYLGVVPNIDDYQLLPPEEEQIGIDSFTELFDEAPDSKPVLKGSKSTPQGKNVTKNWKSALSKSRPRVKMKIESEEIKGGEAEGLTIQDIAKKHKVPIGNIRKEIKLGAKIEMEHTDSKAKAKEIAMDHITEYPDYYSNKKHGVKASEKGLEKDLEETSTAGGASTGAFIGPLGGKKETIIKKPFAKQVGKEVVGKKSISNPIGKIYTVVKNNESKIINKKDLIKELSSSSSSKLRDEGGSFDGDAWVGDKDGWERKDELNWPGGEISDILAKMDINWNDSDLSLTDKQTDKINEGWLFKTKEDKMVLNILKRVKQNFPTDITIGVGDRRYKSGPKEGEDIRFSLPGIKQNAIIRVTYGYSTYGDTYAYIEVNNRRLKASEWAIKKIYKYLYDILEERHDKKSLNQIQADLTDPNFAQDVFDILGDEDVVNEGKYLIKIHSFKDNKDMLVSSDIWQHEYQGDPKVLLKNKPDLAKKLVYTTKDNAKITLSKIKKARGGTRKTDSYSIIPLKESINEGVGTFLLTAVGVYSFYKFIQGLRGKDKPKESKYGKSNWKILLYYVKDFIEQGGKIEYEDNDWYHVFKVGDVTIKIDQNNKTVFWTHIVPDNKRFLKYKPEKRFEFTDIDEIEHEHTIPIPISQENIDSLVSAVKEDMGHKEINETKKKKTEEEDIEEATTHASVWGANGPPVVPIFGAKGKDHVPSRKPIFKGGKIVQKINNSGVLTEQIEVEDSPIPGVTSAQFRDELMDIWGLQNVEFIKKGVYSTDSKEEYILNNEGFINTPKADRPKISSLKGKTIMTWTQDMEYSIQELNKVKWVKGGKYVKIKDKCAKYNNQPWCSQGAIDNPLEFSDTVFENIKGISKKTGIKESEILDKIKAKLNGVSKEKIEYNKKHGLPIWWQGSKEGFYEKMEPRKNNTGSN